MSRFATSVFMLVGLIGLIGCKVTPEELEKWKGTQKGPDKLVAVLLDDKYEPSLRAQAAVALADIDEPVHWETLEKAFKVIPEPQRTEVLEAMVPLLATMLHDGNEPPSPPLKSQVAAKDMAHLILAYTKGDTRTATEDLLIEWSIGDFNQRFFMGRRSIDVIIEDVGPRAAEALLGLLGPGSIVYDKVSEYLDKLASEEVQYKAGTLLVELAKERIKAWEGRVDEALLVALGRMGGPDVRDYLLDLAADPSVTQGTQRAAMMAYLQFNLAHKDSIEKLYIVAENTSQGPSTRNWAYDAIVSLGDKEQKTRVAKLLHDTGPEKDKYRGVGVDELLRLLGSEGIPFIMEELILEEDPWADWLDLRDYVPVRFGQDFEGKPLTGEEQKKAREAIRPFLEHKEPFARGIACYTLGLIGDQSDLAKLEQLKKDKGKLNGWRFAQGEEVLEDFPTVGSVAEWAITQQSAK
jgi:HEAT repeat protein